MSLDALTVTQRPNELLKVEKKPEYPKLYLYILYIYKVTKIASVPRGDYSF